MLFVPRTFQIGNRYRNENLKEVMRSIINLKKITNSFGVSEQRNIKILNKDFLFFVGLFLRLILIFFVTPLIHKEWFLPFLEGPITDITIDPYTTFIQKGGDYLSFPYGIVMYLFYKVPISIGYSLDQLFGISYITKISLGLSSLLFDLGTLYGIAFIAKKYSIKSLLLFYWCSPIVIYIVYWHGQLDILPICLLIWSISLMHIEKPIGSGILLGLAISAKYSMLISLPFILIYYLRNKRLTKQLYLNLIPFGMILISNILIYFISNGFGEMVIQSPETNKLFYVNVSYGSDLKLYILPTVFLVLIYVFWRLEKITLDLLFVSIGIGFFSVLILLPPSPGWFLWVIPFLCFYQIRSKGDFLFTAIPFYVFFITYNFLYSRGAYINFLEVNLNNPIIEQMPNKFEDIRSIIFTGLQASGLIVSLKMYQFGIWRNNYYSGLRGKLAIGITGNDQKKVKNLVKTFPNILVNERLVNLTTDNYRKWEVNFANQNISKKNDILSFNLIEFSKDFFNVLNKRNIVNENNKYNKYREFNNREYKNSNIIFVTGHHCLVIKRIREKIPLKILFNTYKRKEFLEIKNNADKKIYDLSFSLIREDSNKFNSNLYKYRQLNITMANGFFHEQLVRNLIALSSLKVDLQQSDDLEKVSLSLSGDISGEDILLISKSMIVNSEDLIFYNSKWSNGMQGLIELILAIHIADLYHQRSI